jgi:hypothetical protein
VNCEFGKYPFLFLYTVFLEEPRKIFYSSVRKAGCTQEIEPRACRKRDNYSNAMFGAAVVSYFLGEASVKNLAWIVERIHKPFSASTKTCSISCLCVCYS